MAEKNTPVKNGATTHEKRVDAVKPLTATPTVTYTVDEFASAPQSVGVKSPDIVRAAFKVANKDNATIEEAKKIVETFKKKEVK